MRFAIEERFKSVERLVAHAENQRADPEAAAYYCKLGSVLICGAIERSVEIVISDRINSRSASQVASFLKKYFKRGTNYNCDEVCALLYSFDNQWGKYLEDFVNDNDRVKESISSCYAVRNSVAHGGGQSLGPQILRQYFDDAFLFVCEIEKAVRA